MTHEILSVKLYELDEKIGQLHSRIQLSETADIHQLTQEMEALEIECEAQKLTLQRNLRFSKADIVSILADAYEEINKIIQKAQNGWKEKTVCRENPDIAVEDGILLAEYALDFAMQAADHALLLAMSAMIPQKSSQTREGTL